MNKDKPVFRRRTGIRSIRRKSKDKWDKWRVPRGIDINWKRGDGNKPKIGYRLPKTKRGLHPKGKKEMLIRNKNDILSLSKEDKKNYVFRFAKTIGKKKKLELLELAKKEKIVVLN